MGCSLLVASKHLKQMGTHFKNTRYVCMCANICVCIQDHDVDDDDDNNNDDNNNYENDDNNVERVFKQACLTF